MAAIFVPRDRTRREHLGDFERVVWCDDDAPRVIVKLKDGASAVGPACSSQFIVGQRYRFHGRWADGKFGPQFQFDTMTLDVPLGRNAVVKYLTETCRGVGKVTAERIFDKFGSDSCRTLREEPLAIANAGFLSPDGARDAAQDLERFAHVERTKVELFGLFAGRGFPGRLIDRAIATWGVRAPEVIRQNPFTLLVRKLPGVGWKRADKLYLDMGKPPAAFKRQAMAAYFAMKDDRTGSTWLDADDVASKVIDQVPGSDPFRAMVLLRRAAWVRVRRDGRERFVAPRERADAEQRIADNVRRLSRSASPWPAAVLTSAAEGDGLPSVHQGDQLVAATRGAIGCFTGGPGTGKTHSLSFLLKQVMAEHGPEAIAVCAPTGKAAVRAGESLRARGLGIQASTIHRLLEIGRNGHDGDGWGFERDRDNPLDVRFLVVDESSMIDTALMADLLDGVPDGAGVLFVGDPFQLPPVGHGAPLRDLLAADRPQGELTEVRRNAGSIVRGCAAIKAGLPVEFDEAFDLDAPDPKNLRIIDCPQSEALAALEDVLEGMRRFDPAWETQIITGLNDKSDLSRRKVNDKFGKLLNPDGKRNPKNPFAVGDKIICLRNTRLKVVVPVADRWGRPDMAQDAANYQPVAGGRDGQEWYVANGEIGRVVAVSEKATVARFGGSDVPLVTIANTAKREVQVEEADAEAAAASDFDLAWAITVHRSQGSEWPAVVGLIDDAASQIADRNFWYTAISRM
jgi:exodeoxyribonuclease V alpha subunit